MTPSKLKLLTLSTSPYFFTRSTMRFFGDTMKNYGVRQTTLNNNQVWELYRKNPVKHGLRSSAYFKFGTFERVYSNNEFVITKIKEGD